ncbi:Fungal specific transcription factor, putative [Penicillium digitatum]|uniref:Fungal specific transcription factor, putative n=1 Tax=Penicillium digitatum TaxID=36651 RepID=A0A7T6XPI1_PENDI|nr:Fungal specific transcription factor, putative [Penicillium digitatum]
MSRPQVSIDRLTPRRATVEPRETMNCKSCRKRKIKCNRMRPSCEACKVFQCPCLYDAVPKKRGPKTDVLEALLKRVDGLEKRLHDEKNPISPTSPDTPDDPPSFPTRRNTIDTSFSIYSSSDRSALSTSLSQHADPFSRPTGHSANLLQQPSPTSSGPLSDAILDIYFDRLHGKPFYIIDEATMRQYHQVNQLPPSLAMAISALTVRYTTSHGQMEQSLRTGLDAALQARQLIDVDNPTVEGLQTLLLLSQAFYAYGLGKKAYMTFSNCVAMIVALDLYHEAPSKPNVASAEREMRRRLFWSVYLMDRFINCGSRRPCLITDHSVVLRLPSWSPHAAGLNLEGELFHVGPNIQYSADSRRKSPSAASLLIDITRILGVTNKYLAAGGVKGDSHFPWHALSNLSKIRQELDIWAAGTQDVFASIDALFGHPESTTLLLSKLIYHLVHCLIYRPFLPIDLVELRGTGQHQSWQIEATNLCFSHSNAIAELVELGRNSPLIEWPAFVGYCVCTAGTVHVHGVHYKGREGEVFSSSAEFLTREMNQLAWLRNIWTGAQHQRELLQTIYTCHSELVRNLASSPMRFSPVFHLEDFLDRYPGLTLDGSHVRLIDAGDELAPSPANFIDRQDHFYQRPAPAPSYQNASSYFSNSRSGPLSPLASIQSSDNDRRHSHSHSVSEKPSHPTSLSPTLQFHSIPSNQQQQSPSLPSIFSLPPGTDLSGAGPSENSHLSIPGFSPCAFGLSPPAFLTDGALNIAPTPPPNPQYATFPFDTAHTNLNGMGQSGHTALTPGAQSQTSATHTATGSEGASEKDPFLSLLEQLAENENSQGGPSELEFFLTGTGAVEGDAEIPPKKDGAS